MILFYKMFLKNRFLVYVGYSCNRLPLKQECMNLYHRHFERPSTIYRHCNTLATDMNDFMTTLQCLPILVALLFITFGKLRTIHFEFLGGFQYITCQTALCCWHWIEHYRRNRKESGPHNFSSNNNKDFHVDIIIIINMELEYLL